MFSSTVCDLVKGVRIFLHNERTTADLLRTRGCGEGYLLGLLLGGLMGLLLLGQWHTLQDTLILCLRLSRLGGGGVGDMTPSIKTFLTVGLQTIFVFFVLFLFSYKRK